VDLLALWLQDLLITLNYLNTEPSTSNHYEVFLQFLVQSPWNLGTQLKLISAEFESYIMTDSQSASLSWNKAPVWGLRPDFYYCQTVAGLLIRGALSDERTGLSFTIAAGPRQRSHSRVRVPWDSRPYFSVSHLRLPFLSPLTTRRAMVEVFDSASTRDSLSCKQICVI
jgi:hypothetical protein